MKILHYALGFSPYRTGGLTKYCEDLMKEQILAGHEVMMLWPGSVGCKRQKVIIRKRRRTDGIISCELCGALPVALDEGILNVEAYMKKTDINGYLDFLNMEKPDVIHMHTFMGVHREFLEAAKKLGIPIVYTTHDYYGLCFKTTFFNAGEVCSGECVRCPECNQTALPLWKTRLLQTPLYRYVKDSALVKYYRKRHRKKFFDANESGRQKKVRKHGLEDDYVRLRKYYISMFQLIDFMHFNSDVTRKIFLNYIEPANYQVISISHAGIKKSNTWKKVDPSQVRISFLAPLNPAKGYCLLQNSLHKLYESGHRNFVFQVFAGKRKINEFTESYDRYEYEQLPDIMEKTDLVVVPSVWYETFSFVVLESLSYGVPVLTSDRVGAADLIMDGKNGWVFKLSEEVLTESLRKILEKPEMILGKMAQYMEEEQKVKNMRMHADEMEGVYNRFHENEDTSEKLRFV